MSIHRNAKYCAVEACPSKSTNGVRLHYFPRDDAQRELWTEFVRGSGRNDWTPKKASRICSLHFTDDCYLLSRKLTAQFGLHTHLRPVPGAVPTIYVPDSVDLGGSSVATEPPKRWKSEGYYIDVVAACASGSSLDVDGSTRDSTNAGSCIEVGGSVKSSAYFVVAVPCPDEPLPNASASDVQTQCYVQVALKSTQASIKPQTRSIRIPTKSRTREIACQTDLALPDILLLEDTREVSTPVPQCQRPPLGEISFAFEDDPRDTNCEPGALEELDSSAVSGILQPAFGQPPVSASSKAALDEPTASDPAAAASGESSMTTSVSGSVMRKFIVCEDSLLELFKTCRKCHRPVTPSLQVTGSLVVKTTCSLHTLEWHSQLKEKRYAVG